MGKRGPQPTPTEELKRRGSWRAKTAERVNEIELAKAKSVPIPPSWLDAAAKKEYQRIAKVLVTAELITTPDADMVAHLAVALIQWREICDNPLIKFPVTSKDGVTKRNPIYAMRSEAHRDVIRLMKELGMSPASRVGLVVQNSGAKKIGEIVEIKNHFAT
jgi:P27 family predicted phage terminase small subunit